MIKLAKNFIKKLKKSYFDFCKKRMKIGVSYNLFDGEELLEFSIKSIRKKVHHISVVYQAVSNFGQSADLDLVKKLKIMKENGLIDSLYEYKPDLKINAHENEKKKRDIGLLIAKKNRCNYFLSMDVDEFYDENQFEFAINSIIKNGIKSSAVSIVEYLKQPEYQIVGSYTFVPENSEHYNFYVPFIIKIRKFGRQYHGKGYFPCETDATRKLLINGKFKLFAPQDIVMHHMSTIRVNLNKKYENSSFMDSPEEFQKYIKKLQKDIVDFDFEKNKQLPNDCAVFRKNIVIKVPNRFNICL